MRKLGNREGGEGELTFIVVYLSPGDPAGEEEGGRGDPLVKSGREEGRE